MDPVTDFAATRPGEVIRRGGETYIKAEAVADLLDEAERRGMTVLGMEGFLISGPTIYTGSTGHRNTVRASPAAPVWASEGSRGRSCRTLHSH